MSRDSDPVRCPNVTVRSKCENRDRSLAGRNSVESMVNDVAAIHLISVELDFHSCWPGTEHESEGKGDLH
jgi:hypothetical protein